MLDEIPSRILSEWEIFLSDEPLDRSDHFLASLLVHVHNFLEGGDAHWTLEDLMSPKSQQTQDQQVEADLAFIDALVATGKVVDLRKRKK